MATAPGGSPQLWLALMFFYHNAMLAATQISRVSLNPPWNRILRGENVTLTCHGKHFLMDNTTKWTHNGTVSEVTTSYLDIINASVQDSGEYKCQKQGSSVSKAMNLEVISDWLLLQASTEVVLEGQPFTIRCHGWRNWNVVKVSYYKDDIAFKYLYKSANISIANAKADDSGAYHCTGYIWKQNYTSERLKITVLKVSQSKYYPLRFIILLLVVILFAVDTGLFVSTQEEFKSMLKIQETRKAKNLLPLSQTPKGTNVTGEENTS